MNTLILELGYHSIKVAVNNGCQTDLATIGSYLHPHYLSSVCSEIPTGEFVWGDLAKYWAAYKDCRSYTLATIEKIPEYKKAISDLLTQLLEDIDDVTSIVYIIPSYWTPQEPKRTLLEHAAQNNHISNVNFIPTPISVLNKVANLLESEYVLFYDAGYKGTSISLLQRQQGTIELIDSVHVKEVGGQSYDRLILQKINDNKIMTIDDIYYQILYSARLEEEASAIKESLSCNAECQLPVNSGESIFKLTLPELENLITSSLSVSFQACWQLLQDNHIDMDKLTKIYLYGGTCHIPHITTNLQSYAKAQFNNNIQIINILKEHRNSRNLSLYGVTANSSKSVILKF